MSSRPPAGLPHTRVALVTVADAGLGRAVARELAEAGMTVYVGARREKAGQKAERELRASGLDARHVPLDLDEDATMARAAELVERSSGRLDVLVNMVGLTSSSTGPVRIRRMASERCSRPTCSTPSTS